MFHFQSFTLLAGCLITTWVCWLHRSVHSAVQLDRFSHCWQLDRNCICFGACVLHLIHIWIILYSWTHWTCFQCGFWAGVLHLINSWAQNCCWSRFWAGMSHIFINCCMAQRRLESRPQCIMANECLNPCAVILMCWLPWSKHQSAQSKMDTFRRHKSPAMILLQDSLFLIAWYTFFAILSIIFVFLLRVYLLSLFIIIINFFRNWLFSQSMNTKIFA